jgi:hypothetical protein
MASSSALPNTNMPFAFYAGLQPAPEASRLPHPQRTAFQRRMEGGIQDRFHPRETQALVPIPGLTPQEMAELQQHPKQTQAVQGLLSKNLIKTPRGQWVETPQERLAMYHRLHAGLSSEGKQALNRLLQQGRLLDTQGDTPNSTLYYLYGMATTKAAYGWNNQALVEDMLHILTHENDIEQNNTPLLPEYQNHLLDATNAADGSKHEAQALPTPRRREDLDVINTFNCSEAAEMARMASLNPKELTRHLYELTRPGEAFYEQATPQELSPEDPSQAYMVLARQNMAYQKKDDGSLLVEVPAARSAVVRAQNTQAIWMQNGKLALKEASPLQVLYQETLLYNGARKGYDVATDKRDMLDIAQTGVLQTPRFTDAQKAELVALLQHPMADEARQAFMQRFQQWKNQLTPEESNALLNNVWGENQGLTGDEKLFNERLVNDGKQFQLVNYQALGNPPDPNDPNYGELYLYGYYRNFEDIQQDLLNALKMGEQPILNESIAFAGGKTVAGHEVKLHDADIDPATHETRFYLVNTDDNQKGLERVSARELIPKIGHISLPKPLADKIQQEMMGLNGGVLVPDASDGAHYTLQPTVSPEPVGKPAGSEVTASRAKPLNIQA